MNKILIIQLSRLKYYIKYIYTSRYIEEIRSIENVGYDVIETKQLM